MNTHVDAFQVSCQQLEIIANEMTQQVVKFIGYRERLRIERPLFIVLKEICSQKLGYNLQGLSKTHMDALNEWMDKRQCDRDLENFIRQVFELRVFLIALSSSDPYVRDDALSRVSTTKKKALKFLIQQLRSIVKKALELQIQ